MYAKVLVTLSISIKIIDSFYLPAETNYKPKLERNNIVNKGVWVRNKQGRGEFDRNNIGTFIFRANSLDADNAVQSSFDLFGAGANAMQDSPFVTNYVQRTRRSPDHTRKKRQKKSMKTSKITKSSVEDDIMIKSKLVSDLKPTSVFNEYPYEVAILLNNEANKSKTQKRNEKDSHAHKLELDYNPVNNTGFDTDIKEDINIVSLNTTNFNDTSKRSKKYDHVNDEITNFDMVEDYDKIKTDTDLNNQGRDIFKDKFTKVWKQNSPLIDNNFYKVVPKEPEKSKTLSERSLIKVILMLTKTFKKVMKQHNEIKIIHKDLLNIKQNFEKNFADAMAKFEDFDSKYADMIQFNNKLKSFEEEMNLQKKIFDSKQKEIHKTFTEFQDQQKKFLIQQSQFYAIQKLMLAQNEKINARQNVIAQTQSQISHRQNNFARILKKAKQIMNENKVKINQSYVKKQDKYITKVEKPYTTEVPTKTTTPYTESLKINLFSIPIKANKLENQDALIIEEKDEKQIDDLVYKYYFNNTFIDALMKTKILNNYSTSNSVEKIKYRSKLSKKKRNELETTIMLPVNNSLNDSPVKRERRWINHFSKNNRYRKLNRHRKESTAILSYKESEKKHNSPSRIQGLNDLKVEDPVKSDPYLSMATNFCNQIGQNVNEQALKWCVEKALRRLKFMEIKTSTPPPLTETKTRESRQPVETTKVIENGISSAEQITSNTVPPVKMLATDTPATTAFEPISKITPVYVVSTPPQAIFFPNNDELESNLKQYEITPDTEGNVYYDGSLHLSDYGRIQPESDGGTSDIMPGLIDSNSRVEIDPRVIDMQAKRRAYVRKINQDIMKQINKDHYVVEVK